MDSIAKRPMKPPIRSRSKVQRHMMVKSHMMGLPVGTTSGRRRRQVREKRLGREFSNLKRSIHLRSQFQSRHPIHGIFSNFRHLYLSSKDCSGRKDDKWMKS